MAAGRLAGRLLRHRAAAGFDVERRLRVLNSITPCFACVEEQHEPGPHILYCIARRTRRD